MRTTDADEGSKTEAQVATMVQDLGLLRLGEGGGHVDSKMTEAARKKLSPCTEATCGKSLAKIDTI